MQTPIIGIIGLGYLGQEIARLTQWPDASWGTRLSAAAGATNPLRGIQYDWLDESHWERLPDLSAALIITAPPPLPDAEAEYERLRLWGSWMNRYRPGYRAAVYISTTGVYPNRDGMWRESDEALPDSGQGRLRLTTEKALAGYFELRVIRAGAIYGPGRNIAERMLAGKPVPSGNQPVHRIHVHDLARIVERAVRETDFPAILNAVDLDPAPSLQAAAWIISQKLPQFLADIRFNPAADPPTRKKTVPATNRLISNQLLVDQLQFRFVFPSFREGLLHEYRHLQMHGGVSDP